MIAVTRSITMYPLIFDLRKRVMVGNCPLSKGIIHGVPIADKEDEILAALADQNVVHVKRLPVKGHPEILSETVILTFSSKFPDRVKIAAMIYRVQQSFPIPFRCRKCWLLGHPTSRCSQASVCCKKCGKSHPPESLCSTKCVNCHSPSHDADSDTCPEFVEMKAILKTATTQGITIKEARLQHNRQFSKAVQSTLRGPVRPVPTPALSDSASQQLSALQAEFKLFRESTIPSINASIQSLTQDLEETKEKFVHFDARFDSLEVKQETYSTAQSARFDKLESLLGNLTNMLVQNIGQSSSSPAITCDRRLPTGPPSPGSSIRNSSPSFFHPLGSKYYTPNPPEWDHIDTDVQQ